MQETYEYDILVLCNVPYRVKRVIQNKFRNEIIPPFHERKTAFNLISTPHPVYHNYYTEYTYRFSPPKGGLRQWLIKDQSQKTIADWQIVMWSPMLH